MSTIGTIQINYANHSIFVVSDRVIDLGISSLQPIKLLQDLLGRFPQLLCQIFPLRILARLLNDTKWYQILPFIILTLFEDPA